ncbi:deoxyribose-phosphate aldolase [uncultured Thermanaerothrix sp.]|uniref:deoxyribose-phosphate aldolase n=1 Tax=uncultured Thermanaerothrix sp. TaxID=1195149 RepID=UPI002604A3B0|nr:deoxyribose-phosphate aldolase [uncultured Thermanaerothrix sp.]
MEFSLNDLVTQARHFAQEPPPFELPAGLTEQPITALIDHTLLKPEATPTQIDQLCAEARRYGFAAVCVNPVYVPRAVRALAGSGVRVATVTGFPLGANGRRAKLAETQIVIEEGAVEVDTVIAVGLLKGGEYAAVYDELSALSELCHRSNVILKVIIETALLERGEKVLACLLAKAARADFVKTSTGFSTGGATPEDVELMRRVVGPHMGVKAAGGIRTLADAQAMVRAGANRLGTSAGVKIAEALMVGK